MKSTVITILGLLFSITAFANANDVYCPTSLNITCTSSQCTITGPYAAYWTAGKPSDTGVHPLYGSAEQDSVYTCNYLGLEVSNSSGNLLADTKAKGNLWTNFYGNEICGINSGAISHPEYCPFILKS